MNEITKKDLFAAAAMMGILANRDTAPEADFMFVVEQAGEYAKMLEAEMERIQEKEELQG